MIIFFSFFYSLPKGPAQQQQQQAGGNPNMMAPPQRAMGQASPGTVEAIARELEEPDDTMKNLRKTFAGIFGDM